jgi:hypothetical protein
LYSEKYQTELLASFLKERIIMTDKQNKIINEKIFDKIRATSAFVGILKHYGKLSVPRDVFMTLITEKQEWPNDFIYKNQNP